MKFYQIALFLLFVSYVYTDDVNCNFIANPSKKSDCNEKLSESDKSVYKFTHCCYQELGDLKACVALTQEGFDAIGKSSKSTNTANQVASGVHYKIECNSHYLTIGILSLLFFLI